MKGRTLGIWDLNICSDLYCHRVPVKDIYLYALSAAPAYQILRKRFGQDTVCTTRRHQGPDPF